jgi:hypothetical protein
MLDLIEQSLDVQAPWNVKPQHKALVDAAQHQ